MERPYVLLVTPEEYASIQNFQAMGLQGDELAKAMGEIVAIPWDELCFPIYYKTDPRAPGLRFDYHPTQPPAAPGSGDSSSNGPSPAMPSPVFPTLPSARISLAIEYNDLNPGEAAQVLLA